jgi:Tol biopolymer transport system component
VIRAAVLVLVCGIAASTAGAAAPLARNGLIAFSREIGDNVVYPQIYVISAKGSQRRQVSRHTTFGGPEWAPDGKAIAYPTEGGVIIIRPDGRGRELGFDIPGYADECWCDLDWSPDGKRIAVVAGPLYVKTLGGPLRKLTRGRALSPSWSPDGQLIAYRTPGRVFVVRANGRDRRRLASSSGAYDFLATEPSWSPDGRRLVVEMGGALYVIDTRTRKKRRLVLKAWSEDPLWSPNGQWIAFRRARASGKPRDIYLVHPDGTGLRRLTRTPHNEGSLTWSPRGRRLVYAGRRWDVFILDLADRRAIRVSRRKCGEGADLLTWSPRGNQLAFRSSPARMDAEIVAANTDGTDIRQLTDDCNVWERNPAWSPRGDELAYDRYMGKERHIYLTRKDGSRVRRVTTGRGGGTDPSWSPDAEQLVFSRYPDLFVIGRDGSGERRLTNRTGVQPAWSPRGDKIAFVSGGNGSAQIYLSNPDGSGVVQLTTDGGTEPSWSPDGSRLAFVRAYNIWTMRADGTELVRLTERDGYTRAQSPAWSPDGSQIIFSMDLDGGRGSQFALFVVDAAGGPPRGLPFDYFHESLEPAWQPLP